MNDNDKTPLRTPSGATSLPAPESIRQQLNRILTSPEFGATDTQRSFLTFVVETSLSGRAHEIKGFTVATRVFGRGENFDQATDPIVSIQANKLRRALERYYLVAGQNDPIRIDIPKGAYVPVFQAPAGPGDSKPLSQKYKARASGTDAWPTILVESFENLTGDRELDYIGIGIATEIALEITRYQEVRVLRQSTGGEQRRSSDSSARFVLCGSIKKEMTGLKVIVSLVDGSTGIHLWGDSHRTDLDPAGMVSFEEKIAGTVTGKISCEYGVIAKTLSPESKRIPPTELTTYQAMLLFYKFLTDFSAQTFMDSFEALQQACKYEPECGLAWSMLARLYSLNYSLELFAIETPLEKAADFAEKGITLEPANQRVRTINAFILLFKNELAAGLAEVDRALQLNPSSLLFLENIGYLMTLFGDWKKGPVLIRKAIEQNPHYNITVHYALWMDWVRQAAYDQAFAETLHFRQPGLFWDPLLKAASLGLQGKIDEGVQAGKELLKCKPDFPERGRVLIRHYIKFDDIVERVILGLEKVGIEIF
jgi:TolB-like protein